MYKKFCPNFYLTNETQALNVFCSPVLVGGLYSRSPPVWAFNGKLVFERIPKVRKTGWPDSETIDSFHHR